MNTLGEKEKGGKNLTISSLRGGKEGNIGGLERKDTVNFQHPRGPFVLL